MTQTEVIEAREEREAILRAFKTFRRPSGWRRAMGEGSRGEFLVMLSQINRRLWFANIHKARKAFAGSQPRTMWTPNTANPLMAKRSKGYR